MTGIINGLIAHLRYVFVVAALALAVLAVASLAGGVAALVTLLAGAAKGAPITGAAVVPFFIRAAFLYFLAAAFASLFVGDLPVPQWMVVRNLFQFKNKVLTFVAVIVALNFLNILARGNLAPQGVLYTGGGVFLALGGIFLLIRFGSPSGDEAMSREGNRPPAAAGRDDRRQKPRGGKPQEQKKDRGDWLDKQKDKLKFEKESLARAMEDKKPEEGGQRPQGNVTVKPGPRRPVRRRRPGGGGGGKGGDQ